MVLVIRLLELRRFTVGFVLPFVSVFILFNPWDGLLLSL